MSYISLAAQCFPMCIPCSRVLRSPANPVRRSCIKLHGPQQHAPSPPTSPTARAVRHSGPPHYIRCTVSRSCFSSLSPSRIFTWGASEKSYGHKPLCKSNSDHTTLPQHSHYHYHNHPLRRPKLTKQPSNRTHHPLPRLLGALVPLPRRSDAFAKQVSYF